jgi:diguanylate cyclase (GGDEF)-like protein
MGQSSNTILEEITEKYYSEVRDNPSSIGINKIKTYLSTLANPLDRQELLLIIRDSIADKGIVIDHRELTKLERTTLESIRENNGVDSLTKLDNRTKYPYDAPNLIRQYGRENHNLKDPKTQLAILSTDINQFKKEANEKYTDVDGGHSFGDDVLIYFAKAIKKYTRSDDKKYRWGGDEFLIIQKIDSTLTENFEKHIKDLAKNINNYVQDKINKRKDDKQANVSLSIGVAFYKQDAETIDEVIKKADKAMFYAKKNSPIKHKKDFVNVCIYDEKIFK